MAKKKKQVLARRKQRITLSAAELKLLQSSGAIRQVREKLFRQEVQKHSSGTIGDLLEAAKSGGWLPHLKGLTVQEILPAKRTASATPIRKKRGSTRDRVLQFVRSNSDSATGHIAKSLKLKPASVSSALQVLKEDGKVTVAGERRGARWNGA